MDYYKQNIPKKPFNWNQITYSMYFIVSILAMIYFTVGILTDSELIITKAIGFFVVLIWARVTGLYKFI
jgi:hypothetical protein